MVSTSAASECEAARLANGKNQARSRADQSARRILLREHSGIGQGASENHPANGIVPWRTIADRVLAAVRSHLDAQRQAVLRHLAGHAGELIGEFCEIESGRRSDRPQLAAAIVAAKKARATLIIAKLDRLARNVHFISGLMESGVDFVAADNPHANKLMVHMLAAFARRLARPYLGRTYTG